MQYYNYVKLLYSLALSFTFSVTSRKLFRSIIWLLYTPPILLLYNWRPIQLWSVCHDSVCNDMIFNFFINSQLSNAETALADSSDDCEDDGHEILQGYKSDSEAEIYEAGKPTMKITSLYTLSCMTGWPTLYCLPSVFVVGPFYTLHFNDPLYWVIEWLYSVFWCRLISEVDNSDSRDK